MSATSLPGLYGPQCVSRSALLSPPQFLRDLFMRYSQFSALAVSAALLSACASGVPVEETPPIEEIDQIIAEAVETSSSSNRAIAEVEVATAGPVRAGPQPSVPPTVVLPPEAVQPVTLDWQGPIEPLIRDLATRAGYTFRATGRAPANMKMISIVANEEPLFGIIRRAGAMAHGYADIAFNPGARTIEIRYGG